MGSLGLLAWIQRLAARIEQLERGVALGNGTISNAKLMIDALVSRNVIDPHGRNARSKTSNNAAMLPDTRPLP